MWGVGYALGNTHYFLRYMALAQSPLAPAMSRRMKM